MARPFRFAARIPDLRQPASAWREEVRKLDDLGYDTVAVSDHFTGGAVWEPLVTLMAAAGASSRLRLLTLVLGNDYRHPVVLHKAAATIDALSDGRLELGIGAGWMISDYEAAGIPYYEAGVRVSRFEESVKVVKGLFGGEPFSFDGRHYKITALEGLPMAVQQPRPPILIGGGGRRVLGIAAREADIVGINANLSPGAIGPAVAQDMSAERTDLKVGWLREALGKAGRADQVEIQTSVFMMKVTDSESEATEMKKGLAAGFGLEVSAIGDSPAVLVGSVDECVEKLQERRERWSMSYVTLPDAAAGAPIVARLAGK